MEKHKYFNLEAILEDEGLTEARDDDGFVIEYSHHGEFVEKDVSSGYGAMWLSYG